MIAVALSGFGTGAAAGGGGSLVPKWGGGGLAPEIVTIFSSEPPRLDLTFTWAGGTGMFGTSADKSAGNYHAEGLDFQHRVAGAARDIHAGIRRDHKRLVEGL